jgi:hypothetical protein
LAISAFAIVAALKKVDFPQLGFPARARVIMVGPQMRWYRVSQEKSGQNLTKLFIPVY